MLCICCHTTQERKRAASQRFKQAVVAWKRCPAPRLKEARLVTATEDNTLRAAIEAAKSAGHSAVAPHLIEAHDRGRLWGDRRVTFRRSPAALKSAESLK